MDTQTDNTEMELTQSELIKRALGKVVALHRDRAGFKQRQFSSVVGISNSHLRSIEAGNVSPTFITICKIAETLEEPPENLISEAWEEILAERPRVCIDYQKRTGGCR